MNSQCVLEYPILLTSVKISVLYGHKFKFLIILPKALIPPSF